ncbi:MAG TPA: hypothetical protein VN408_12325 [Actinoplanes sp.]|nr:hypothetical protein [Actinoplanes sp.]
MANRFPLWGQAGWASAEVVGETHYAKAIRALFGPDLDPRGADITVPVQLIPDRSNKHDRNAVGVWSGSHLLGHLPRPEAARYVAALTALATRGLIPEVNARITGREWGAADGRPAAFDATVRLDLAEPHMLVPVNAPPAQDHRLLPSGSAVQVVGQQQYLDALTPLLRPEGECWAYVTLHETADHLVEVRVGDVRVGDLSPKMSGELLPVLRHMAEQGVVTAARAIVRGNSGKTEVMLYVARVQDLPESWQGAAKRPAAGRGTASVPAVGPGVGTPLAATGSATAGIPSSSASAAPIPGMTAPGSPAPGLMSGGPAAGGLVPNWVSGEALPSWASGPSAPPPPAVPAQVVPSGPFPSGSYPSGSYPATASDGGFAPVQDMPAPAFPSRFAGSLGSAAVSPAPGSPGVPQAQAGPVSPGPDVPPAGWTNPGPDAPAAGWTPPSPDASAAGWANPGPGPDVPVPGWANPSDGQPTWTPPEDNRPVWTPPEDIRPSWAPPDDVRPSWAPPEDDRSGGSESDDGVPAWAGSSGAMPGLAPAARHTASATIPVRQTEGSGTLLADPATRPVSPAVVPVSPASAGDQEQEQEIAETTVIPALAAVVKANPAGLATAAPVAAEPANPHAPIPPAPTGIRFEVPAGWPTPPDGWYPPAGWIPDPSWPPAPAGWQWWIPTWE